MTKKSSSNQVGEDLKNLERDLVEDRVFLFRKILGITGGGMNDYIFYTTMFTAVTAGANIVYVLASLLLWRVTKKNTEISMDALKMNFVINYYAITSERYRRNPNGSLIHGAELPEVKTIAQRLRKINPKLADEILGAPLEVDK